MSPRDEWMLMANMMIPVVATSSEDARDHTQYTLDLAKNFELTRKAVTLGIALSAIDGPLPVMDVIAFAGVSAYSALLWGQFYFQYHY